MATREKQYWLLKSEGDTYPITALKKDGTTPWTGVRNYRARNIMRDEMRVGDLCLFYHSSSDPMGVFGVAKVASKPYPDPTQFDKKSEYYDAKASREKPIWYLVDVAYVRTLRRPVTLSEIKADPALSGMMLTKPVRLSIQPVSPAHYAYIVEKLAS